MGKLTSVGMVVCERRLWNLTTIEVRFYISSLEHDALVLANAVRSHWGIENSVHWGGVSAGGVLHPPNLLYLMSHCYDYEYERHGVCNLFMFSEPLIGWRCVEVTDRRTKQDYAQQMKYLVDVRYPHAEMIIVVHDQLNTHVPSSLYEAFEPADARRILDKLEFHYTHSHGSWLNMAEMN